MSMGRVIPYIMENKIHVWNHQPDLLLTLFLSIDFDVFPSAIAVRTQVPWNPSSQASAPETVAEATNGHRWTPF
jgi:hypothetical protein